MSGALIFLTARSMFNFARSRVVRVRQPRYLVGAIGGILWLLLVLRPQRTASGRQMRGFLGMLEGVRTEAEVLAAVFLLLVLAAAWLWPKPGAALTFTLSEVAFLFPAPLTRRQLIIYKLLRGQLAALFSSAIVTLFLRPPSAAVYWFFFVGFTVTMATVTLHLTGVALRRRSLVEHGRLGWRQQWLPLVIVLAAVVIVIGTAVAQLGAVAAASSLREQAAVLTTALQQGAAGVVLWPFRLLTRAPLATTLSALAVAAGPALLLLAVNVWWVLRSDVRFEEASAAQAEKVAATVARGLAPAPVVRRGVNVPFALSPAGRPELAILWKNLISIGRYLSVRSVVQIGSVLLAIIGVMATRGSVRGGAVWAAGCAMAAMLTVMMGPQMMTHDLRNDLRQLAAIKAWPVRGAAIVLGEVLAPTLALTVLLWFLLAAIAILMAGRPGPVGLPSLVMAAAIAGPAVVLAQVILCNALAVMFPAWVLQPRGTGGIEAIGQRLVVINGTLLGLALVLLVPAAAGAAVAFALRLAGMSAPIVPAAIAGTAVLVIECALGIELVGRQFERTDVSEV